MKRTVTRFFVAALLLIISSFASADEIKKGDVATVLDWEEVKVVNLEPVSQDFGYGVARVGYGEKCAVNKGGIITVVGIDGDRTLVRYSFLGRPSDLPCPSGVLFFITREKFSNMTRKLDLINDAEKAEKNLVKRLLEIK